MSAERGRFFQPAVAEVNIGPIFHKPHIFLTFLKVIFQNDKSGENVGIQHRGEICTWSFIILHYYYLVM